MILITDILPDNYTVLSQFEFYKLAGDGIKYISVGSDIRPGK